MSTQLTITKDHDVVIRCGHAHAKWDRHQQRFTLLEHHRHDHHHHQQHHEENAILSMNHVRIYGRSTFSCDKDRTLSILIVVTHARFAGRTPVTSTTTKLSLQSVMRVTGVEFVVLPSPSCSSSAASSSYLIDQNDDVPIPVRNACHEIEHQIHSGALNLYYSIDGDLSQPLQLRVGDEPAATSSLPFQFNACRENDEVERLLVTPVVRGFFDCTLLCSKKKRGARHHQAWLSLIARQSPHGAGPRYHRRGAHGDSAGAANLFETEQVVFVTQLSGDGGGAGGGGGGGGGDIAVEKCTSYVMFRGSVPRAWSQQPSLFVMKPAVHLHDEEPHHRHHHRKHASIKRHVDALQARSGTSLRLLSMLSSRSHEAHLAKAYADSARHHNYDHVDFDTNTLMWKTLEKQVIDHAGDEVVHRDNLHVVSASSDNTKRQRKTLRINCLDACDRTALGQVQVAVRMFEHQLREVAPLLDIVGAADEQLLCDDASKFSRIHRALLLDMNDAISTLYAGSGALFPNVVVNRRGGVRMRIADAYRGLQRFAFALWRNSTKQEADAVLVGTSRLDPNWRSLLTRRHVQFWIHIAVIVGVIASVLAIVTVMIHWSTAAVLGSIGFLAFVKFGLSRIEYVVIPAPEMIAVDDE